MGELVLAGILPHPPIMVQDVGRGEIAKVKATREAMEQLARKLEGLRPETIVVITPHGAVFSDAITMPTDNSLAGNLHRFGAPQVEMQFTRDKELGELLYNSCLEREVSFARLDQDLAGQHEVSLELDHGVVVPLSFFNRLEPKPLLLQINMGILPREQLYAFGIALQEAIQQSLKRVAVFASSDLSHRVTPDAPGGYNPQGKKFDLLLKGLLEDFDVPGILSISEELQEEAGECGYRPIVMLLGVLDGYEVESKVLSYEAPFGVGYLVAQFMQGEVSEDRKLQAGLQRQREIGLKERTETETPIVKLARKSLEHYYATGKILESDKNALPPDLPKKAGVFVTLKKDGQLRGCIGTTAPTKPELAGEVIANALKAATEDPRFDPVDADELVELAISVDVLGTPEPIAGLEELDPEKYGVIVKSGWRTGLLLPALAGVDTAQEQVGIARQKAGISPEESVKLERFLVTRFT